MTIQLPPIRKAAVYVRSTYWGRAPLHASADDNEELLLRVVEGRCDYDLFYEASSYKRNEAAMELLRWADMGEFDAIVTRHIHSFGLGIKFDWDTMMGLIMARGIRIITPEKVYSRENRNDMTYLEFMMRALRDEYEIKFGAEWDRVKISYRLRKTPVELMSLYERPASAQVIQFPGVSGREGLPRESH